MDKLTTIALSKVKNVIPSLFNPISALILPYLPDKLLAHYSDGKMTLTSLKNNENIFDKLIVDLNKRMEEESRKIISQDDPFNALQIQEQINLSSKYIRYVRTLKKSLKYIENNEVLESKTSNENTSPSWFDLFRDISTRMNEEWREDLLARCVAMEDMESGSISLRTLWGIGLLETEMFHAFALFLDSSIDIDGYPIITLERDDLTLNIESTEGNFHGVLIHMISGLIDWGLVQHGDVVLPSSEPIIVDSCDKSAKITNLRQKDNETTLMRFYGYHCTDLGLDLYRLYEPKYNHISKLNFQALLDLLKELDNVKTELI